MNETITRVDGTGGVTTETGSFYIGKGFESLPKVGDTVSLIVVGGGEMSLGREFRGVILNGVTLWEKSEEEVAREHQQQRDEFARKEREAEEKSRADYASRLALDPLAFDWDREGPSERAAAALNRVTPETADAEFPISYSGQSWRYAWHLWLLTAKDPDALDGLGAYERVPAIPDEAYEHLSGFMEGWARNAVRQMRGKLPKTNPALVSVGAGDDQPLAPSIGSAEQALKRVLG